MSNSEQDDLQKYLEEKAKQEQKKNLSRSLHMTLAC